MNKKIRKTVPVSRVLNYQIKQVSEQLHISDATLINFAIERLLIDIKKNTLKKSDLIGMIVDEK